MPTSWHMKSLFWQRKNFTYLYFTYLYFTYFFFFFFFSEATKHFLTHLHCDKSFEK